jgi:hypothetical protein
VNGKRFFSLAWRANALLILVTGLLAACVLVFALWQIYKEATHTRQATNVLNVAQDQVDSSKTSLGQFEKVAGTSVMRASLTLEQGYSLGSGSKGATSTQNYLFFDTASGKSWWLLPGHRGLILSEQEIPHRQYDDRKTPVVAFLYEIVASDSSGDKRLTDSDLKSLAISDPTGTRLTRLIEGVQDVNGTDFAADGTLTVLYTAAQTLRAARIDLGSQKVLSDSALQPVSQDARQ